MIFLGIGSNLTSFAGDRFDNINLSLEILRKFRIKVVKKSSYFETFSYPNKKDPKFINIVICIKTNLSPHGLMKKLILTEKILGRRRTKKNKPRICDIDILDYNKKIINIKYKNLQLKIPHKKLTNRNFVLYPLKEIYPTWKHPKTNEIVDSLIRKLPIQDRKSILKVKKN